MMIEAGEIDVALDELRWLLRLREFIAAHVLLGDIARDTGDSACPCHYAGYQLGLQTLRRENAKAVVVFAARNQSFFESGRGLVWALKTGKPQMAEEVMSTLSNSTQRIRFNCERSTNPQRRRLQLSI